MMFSSAAIALISKITYRYLELEETCLQYKTKHQLLNKIDPTYVRKRALKEAEEARFLSGF